MSNRAFDLFNMHPFILFLDFDGVLHSGTSGTVRHAPAIERLLQNYPDARIVVSSNWRMNHSLEDLRGWFSPAFGERLIDVTPLLPHGDRAGGRQAEIEHWLAAHPTSVWRAIDDDTYLFQPNCPWLIITDKKTGLTDLTLAELDKALAQALPR